LSPFILFIICIKNPFLWVCFILTFPSVSYFYCIIKIFYCERCSNRVFVYYFYNVPMFHFSYIPIACFIFFISTSSIVVLCKNISPPAVRGFIISISIYSIQRMIRSRFVPHIFKELFKRIQPLIAHFDALATIVFIILTINIYTSLLGTLPRIIFFAINHPMFFILFYHTFLSQAPTRRVSF